MDNSRLKYSKNKSNFKDIQEHLKRCDNLFEPNLSSYVDLDKYSIKLAKLAVRYEFFEKTSLIGLIAVYQNLSDVYISNFSIEKNYLGKGLSKILMDAFILDSTVENLKRVSLEVNKENKRAINFYTKNGFGVEQKKNDLIILSRTL